MVAFQRVREAEGAEGVTVRRCSLSRERQRHDCCHFSISRPSPYPLVFLSPPLSSCCCPAALKEPCGVQEWTWAAERCTCVSHPGSIAPRIRPHWQILMLAQIALQRWRCHQKTSRRPSLTRGAAFINFETSDGSSVAAICQTPTVSQQQRRRQCTHRLHSPQHCPRLP